MGCCALICSVHGKSMELAGAVAPVVAHSVVVLRDTAEPSRMGREPQTCAAKPKPAAS